MKFLALGLFLLSFAIPTVAQEPGQITLSDLRAKYADEGTRYINVDGVEVHYRDEGTGQVGSCSTRPSLISKPGTFWHRS